MTIKRLDKKARKQAKQARDNRKGSRDFKRAFSATKEVELRA